VLAVSFLRDAVKALAVLSDIHERKGAYRDGDIRSYIINVHAMKSALANIGERELSDVAASLERAGRESDLDTVENETPDSLAALRVGVGALKPKEAGSAMTDEEIIFLQEVTQSVRDACGMYDIKRATDALADARRKTWPPQIEELFDAVSVHLLHSDFEEAFSAAARTAEAAKGGLI
jgi:HPt (histidine-containing phosphotransfer) domain-containing protein